MAFGRPADGGIARHEGDVVQVDCEQQRPAAHPCRRQRRLAAGMPGTDNNHVVNLFLASVHDYYSTIVESPSRCRADSLLSTEMVRTSMGRWRWKG